MSQHILFRTSRDLCTLNRLNLLYTATVFAVAQLASLFPLFDDSPSLVRTPFLSQPALRWDVFHFKHIAEHGYVYEYEGAFLSAASAMMSGAQWASELLTRSKDASELFTTGLLLLASSDATRVLYRLTLDCTHSNDIAMLVSTLSILSSSPATLRLAPYAEGYFTWFSYYGMYYCADSQWFQATVLFVLASHYRSNGIFLSGFILWGLLIQPFIDTRKLSLSNAIRAVLYTTAIFGPFVHHNFRAYLAFCSDVPEQADWCKNTVPLLYSHVQRKYWDVGFLRYWTPQQIPNFVIAAPPLAAILAFSYHHLKFNIPKILGITQGDTSKESSTPFLHPSLTPHALHAVFISFTLIFFSHTQIVLRLAASTPITYWAAAWFMVEHPKLGKLWVFWSTIWGLLSVVLWAAFLPPA